MSDIKFRIAAKTDVGCVRTNNEDNFQAAASLEEPTMRWVNNQSYDLGPRGSLLVVADGMGGMNAGEVASAIAIDTVRDFFNPENLTPEVLKSRFTIEKFMKDVVVEADRRIKEQSTDTTRGMGTTIVISWLLGDSCYVCWCGDSRAYIYNDDCGLFQISKDHSYVQSLVDAGEISEEDAFDFPNSNVITRCLCDAKQKAVPDCLLTPQPLCNGDIILLCSDGLSGMLRDKEMEEIIRANKENMDTLSDALIDGALKAGGADNVTVAVACIDAGGKQSTPARIPVKVLPKPHQEPTATVAAAAAKSSQKEVKAPAAAAQKSDDDKKMSAGKEEKKKTPAWIWALVGFIVAAGLFAAAYFLYFNKEKADEKKIDRVEVLDDDEDDISGEEFEDEVEMGSDAEASSENPSAKPAPAKQNTNKGNPAGAQATAGEASAGQGTSIRSKVENITAGSSGEGESGEESGEGTNTEPVHVGLRSKTQPQTPATPTTPVEQPSEPATPAEKS